MVSDALRHHDELREGAGAAVVSAGNPDDLAVVAKVDLALAAELALAAIDRGIEGHPISGFEFFHAGASRGYDSRRFMPHDDRWNSPAGGAVVAMNVATADATGGHTHQNLVRTRLRSGKIGNVKLVILRKEQCFHRR